MWINITKKSTKNGIQQVLMKPQYTVNPLLNLAKSTSDTLVQVDINLKRSSRACLMSFFWRDCRQTKLPDVIPVFHIS